MPCRFLSCGCIKKSACVTVSLIFTGSIATPPGTTDDPPRSMNAWSSASSGAVGGTLVSELREASFLRRL